MFVYAMPVLGFIGTVLSIRAAMGSAGRAAGSGSDVLKAIAPALTSGIASSFDATAVALILSVIVMAALAWVAEKERAALRMTEEFCRVHLVARLEPAPARTEEAAAVDNGEALLSALADLRAALSVMTAETERQWSSGIEKLRIELTSALEKSLGAGQEQAEQAQRTGQEISEGLKGLQAALVAKAAEPAAPAAPERRSRGSRLLDSPSESPMVRHPEFVPRSGELEFALEDLKTRIGQVDEFMRRLSENLRRQAETAAAPVSVRLRIPPQAMSASAND